jgi:sarcosine oxidase
VTRFDVGIVGLGAMGSMAALELARRGRRVIGFDRFRPPHPFGSSHGKSRIIREAYFEHPQYVPLVRRAYDRWRALEVEAGLPLLLPTGGLMIGLPAGILVAGARRSAQQHGLPYEELDAAQVRSRFPVFDPGDAEVGLWEPRAGVLYPEAAIESALRLAAVAGAELHFEEPVLNWSGGEAITLRTSAGHWPVERVILAAGAWMAGELSQAGLPLRVARQPLFWFDSGGAAPLTGPARMPIFIWEWSAERMFYGFPDLGDGVKLAIHHEGDDTDPAQVRRTIYPEEAAELRQVIASRMPRLSDKLRQSTVCLYTNTPDGDFILDRHPDEPRVLLASPCSGHGFKFAPALAEVLADLVEEKPTSFDLSPFGLARFTRKPGSP